MKHFALTIALVLCLSSQAWALRSDLTTRFTNTTSGCKAKSCTPVTLVEFQFSTGTYYASDQNITAGSQAYTALVTQWNSPKPWELKDSLFGSVGTDWEIEVLNVATTYNGASKTFSEILAGAAPENTKVVVYLWFKGLSSTDKAEYEEYYINDYSYDRLTCRLKLVSPLRRYNKPLGYKIIRTDFPRCSYNVVGQSLGYVYGTADNVPLMPLSVGWQSVLAEDITATTTGNIYFRTDGTVGNVNDLPASGTILIGQEELTYDSRAYAAPTSSTDTHNNLVHVTARGANARPYQAGTVAWEKLSSYVYGFPFHSCADLINLRVNNIPQSSGFTVNLKDTAMLAGHELTTVSFTKHPRQIKGVGAHSHISREEIKRSGSAGSATFTTTIGTYTSSAPVPDSTKLGTAQNGYIEIKYHVTGYALGGGALQDRALVTISGAHITTQYQETDVIAGSTGLPPGQTVYIPINSVDWSSDVFSVTVGMTAETASCSGSFTVDSAEWHLFYTGGDSVTAEMKSGMDAPGTIGRATNVTGSMTTVATCTANVPTLIPAPQDIFITATMRINQLNFSGASSDYVSYEFSGAHLTTTTINTGTITTGGYQSNDRELTVKLKVNSPDLSADCWAITVKAKTNAGSDTAVISVLDCTFSAEYPLGNEEVVTGLEIINDGPAVTASIVGHEGYIHNPSFYEGTSYWGAYNVDITPETSTFYNASGMYSEGAQSLKVVNTGLGDNQTDINQTVHQRYATTPSSYNCYQSAQTNTAIANGNVVYKVSLYLRKVGTGGSQNLTVELRNGQATGLPTGSVLATSSNSVAASSLGTSYGWVDFSFNWTATGVGSYGVDIVLVSDKTAGSVDTSNYYDWGVHTGGSYSGVSPGSCRAEYNYTTPGWARTTAHDMAFQVYYVRYGNTWQHCYTAGTLGGRTVTFGGYLDIPVAITGGHGYFAIDARDSAGNRTGWYPSATYASTSGWQYVTATTSALPSNTAYFDFYYVLDGIGTAYIDGQFAYDGWVLPDSYNYTNNIEPRIYANPMDVIANVCAQSDIPIESTSFAAAKTTLKNAKTATGYLANSSFENGLTNWTVDANITATSETVTYYPGPPDAGVKSAKLVNNTQGWHALQSDAMYGLKAGDVLAFGGVFYLPSTISGIGCHMKITFFDSNNNTVGGDGTVTFNDTGGTWQYKTGAVVVPPNTYKAYAFIYMYETGTMYVDGCYAATTGYTFDGLIAGYPDVLSVLSKLQEQSRVRFYYSRGALRAYYVPDTATSARTIDKAAIVQGIKLNGLGLDGIINSVEVNYNQNALNGRYAGFKSASDSTSAGLYGKRERTFNFDFVKDSQMATDLAAFYLARYKNPKKRVSLSLLLDNFDLDWSDAFKVTDNAPAINLTTGTAFELEYGPLLAPGGVDKDAQGGRNVRPSIIDFMGREN